MTWFKAKAACGTPRRSSASMITDSRAIADRPTGHPLMAIQGKLTSGRLKRRPTSFVVKSPPIGRA